MANKCDVAKRVARLKLQLTDTADSATVLKILHKLKDLDITLDILAETGIGKTVNSLRRHEQVGEFAKSLVRGWKRLIPTHSTSQTEDGDLLEGVSVEDKVDYRDCPSNGIFTVDDPNNNLTKTQNSLDDEHFKTSDRNEKIRHRHHSESLEKCRKENSQVSQNVLKQKSVIQEDKNYSSSLVAIEKKSDQSNSKAEDGVVFLRSRSSENIDQKSRSDCKANAKNRSDRGKLGSIKESNKKSKTSKSSKESTESLSFEPCEKYSKTLKLTSVTDDRPSGQPKSPEVPNKKRKKNNEEKQSVSKLTQESESGGYSKQKNKRAKRKHEDKQSDSDKEEPSMSFESYLNYDENVLKRRERSGVKKPKRTMRAVKEMTSMKTFSSTLLPAAASAKQDSVMDLINIPLPADLLQCERPSSIDYFEKKVEREPDFCDLSEEPAVFPGQRLNKKMQVYSGAKTVFLPTMMSLHQQCIRTLQNNINLLYETGGVPFEILEPVLERCTPEQLLRIEEYNPIYIGVTDHLWGKHCQREFKDSRLLEYESWKEMYIRLSEEREMKLQRLTKSIVSAHSNKPKGRQVKMAFIHTVAKPPRDVRIQQEIHGTAAQQPPQLRCSAKVPNSRMRPSCPEPSRSNSTPQAASGNTQDPRKKSRVAPMMAKSLKAFKKQLGRR